MKTTESIILPAEITSLRHSLSFVGVSMGQSGFDGKRIGEIELCLEEILVNIYHYAYPEDQGEVCISCWQDPDGLFFIEISDQGVPFDISSAKEPDINAGIDERKIGGLGIFFVRQLIDDVQYRRDMDRNVLTLCVNQTPSGPSPP